MRDGIRTRSQSAPADVETLETLAPLDPLDPALLDERLAWEDRRADGETPALDWPVDPRVGPLFRQADLVEAMLDDLAPAVDAGVPDVPGLVLRSLLGCGGMGEVWLGEDRALGRSVAVKFPLCQLMPGQLAGRFEREGRALARLRHPNIVAVHTAGIADGRPYLVMDYVPGGSLEDAIDDLSADPRRIATLIAAAADGVEHAHRAGVYHRDLKPANLLIDPEDLVRVTDFGIASVLAEPDPVVPRSARAGDTAVESARLTRSDSLIGTPAYAAPEIHRAPTAPPRPESDVWSLGVILYRAATGGLPFDGRLPAVRDAVLTATPPPPRAINPRVPPWLDAVIVRCLAKSPEARYRTAGELAAALRDGPVLARRRRRLRERVTLALGVLAAFAAITLAALPEDPDRRHERVSARLTADLAKAKPVDLVPEGGMPRTYKAVVNPELLTVKRTDEGVLFDAHGPVFVELLAETPKDGYRLAVQLRQAFFNGRGADAGVYTCGAINPNGTRDHVLVRFSDLGDLASAFPIPGGGTCAAAQIQFVRTFRVPPRPAAVTGSWVDHKQVRRFLAGENPHRLAVDVNDDTVSADLDGSAPLTLSRDTVRRTYFPRDGVPPNTSHVGSVGLYLRDCAVVVSSARLTPVEPRR